MTYEEIMSIGAGDVVPGGYSVAVNATYTGNGESILDKEGNVAPGGHAISKGDRIVVFDIGYSKQLMLIQYPAGGVIRQGYISTNSNPLTKLEFLDLEANIWRNGSTPETVYLGYADDVVLQDIRPNDTAIFLYKVEDRCSIAYFTNKGPYTASGFVHYAGGISPETMNGRCLAGGSSSTDVEPGGIVPGGRTYPANAVIKLDSLYIRDENGNRIEGRETSIGDQITVIDISYSKQLALIQYPSGSDIRQGYVTNNTQIINYLNPYQWVNGSTPETVYLDKERTKQFGTIDAYESGTLLYEKDGSYCVAYDAPGPNGGMDMLNKNGFVKFPGNKPQATPSANDLLYQGFAGNVEKIPYGTSPLGHPLNVYKIGSGSNALFANFAIHGFEDDWNHDGTALVTIANELIRKISATDNLHGWTVYINNCANPDGTFDGITNDGPGRCTVANRIDMNRCFPSSFSPITDTRNYVGNSPLGAPEAVALKNIVEKIHSDHANGEMVVVDFHGWMGMTQGNQEIGKYFNAQFNGDVYSTMAGGFFSTWAQESLSNTKAVLVEYPKNTRSIAECLNNDYPGRTYNAIMNMISSNPGGGSSSSQTGNSNGKINSGVQYVNVREQPNTTSTILGQLYGNNPIQILAKVKPNGDTYYWYKIVFIKDGEKLQAYVREDFVTVTGEIPKDDTPAAGGEPGDLISYDSVGQVNNNAPSVHVRKAPGTGAGCDVITSVNSGQLLMIIGKTQPGGETLPWYEINLNGQELYIRSDFVDIISETKLNEEGSINSSTGWVHLRSLPGTGSECSVITKLNNGDWVEIFGELQPKGESIPWYRIRWQAGMGFVRSDFVSLTKIKVLEGLYNKAREFYPNETVSFWNQRVFDYLRQNKYGNNGVQGVIWNTIIPPYTEFYDYVNKDTQLKQIAEGYMNNEIIDLHGSAIGLPHLSAITLGYIKTDWGIPAFWTGWGGDLATLIGEVIKYSSQESVTSNEALYNKAYELIGGVSSFGLDNFYEDIDAIYFAKNIGLYPITTLINNYYENLVNNRKTIIINSIQENGKSLEDSIFDKFTGPEGLQNNIKGLGLHGFIYSKSGKSLFEQLLEQNPNFIGNIYELCSKAFANRIYSLKNGYLN